MKSVTVNAADNHQVKTSQIDLVRHSLILLRAWGELYDLNSSDLRRLRTLLLDGIDTTLRNGQIAVNEIISQRSV